MKVCHLTSVHPPMDVRILRKECSSLAAAGFDVYLVHPFGNNETVNGVKLVGLSLGPAGRISRMTQYVNRVYEAALKVDADIYHLHDPELIRVGYKLLKRNKKVVYDAHEDLPRQISGKKWIPWIVRKPVSLLAERLENNFAKKTTAVIAATPFIAQRFLRFNTKTVDINNYPILEEFYENTHSKETGSICYVGGISRIRGVFEIVKALELTSVTLHLAGNFEDKEIENELKQLPGWKKVKFYGYVDRKTINEILQSASVGMVTLYPQINYLDSLPVKMFEYMAAGLPVIASDFPYWREILTANKCGVTVNPKSPDEIAKAINSLLGNPALIREMGENGKKAIKEKYNWKIEEKKLIQLYASLK